MAITLSFDDLIARLSDGDGAAAMQVFDTFAGRIIALARRHLRRELRRKLDPEDVLQSVLRSFFLRQRAGEFRLENWESLWGLLMVMTLRKCGRRLDHYQAARRDIGREVSLPSRDEAQAMMKVIGHEPSPAEAAVFADTVEHLLRAVEEEDRQILVLHLQGYTSAEISPRVGRSLRTVRRVIERVRHQLRRRQDQEESK